MKVFKGRLKAITGRLKLNNRVYCNKNGEPVIHEEVVKGYDIPEGADIWMEFSVYPPSEKVPSELVKLDGDHPFYSWTNSDGSHVLMFSGMYNLIWEIRTGIRYVTIYYACK